MSSPSLSGGRGMFNHFVCTLCENFGKFCDPSEDERLRNEWAVDSAIKLLQQYPSGISMPVLLTELEHKWRLSKKRGEHSGKLKQAVTSMQLSLSEVIVAEVTRQDDYRCTLSADGTKVSLIMHRQWFDWTMFLGALGVDALAGRRCAFTQCRLLRLSPPALLPTAMTMFYLRMDSPMDAFVLTDVFHAIYSAFWADYTVPYLTDSTGMQAAQPTGRGAAMEDAVRSMNRPGPQPDNSETLMVMAQVLGCGEPRSYGDGATGSSAEYQLVTLRLLDPATALTGSEAAQESAHVIIYMVLFDDQVGLSRLWEAGDCLLFYRPYLRANAEDGRIFGAAVQSSSANPAHTLAYTVLQGGDPGLLDFVSPTTSSSARVTFMPYHLLYGSVTVVSAVEVGRAAAKKGSGPAALKGSIARRAAATARVISCERIQLPHAPQVSAVEIWAEEEPAPGVAPTAAGLVQVRCAWSLFEVLCGSPASAVMCVSGTYESFSVDVTPEGSDGGCGVSLLASPRFRPGNTVRMTGLTLVPSAEPASASPVPTAVRAYFSGRTGPTSAVGQMSGVAFALGDSSMPLFAAGGAATSIAAGGRTDAAVEGGASAGVACISSLAALTCSPSLVLPVSIRAALEVRGGAWAGCVLVTAQSLQPMHPAVRIWEGEPTHSGRSSQVGQKRSADAACDLRAHVKCGYQLMRARDTSGEVLCVVESAVLVQAGAEAAQQVRHHVVNTSATLFFDPSTGQMTRLVARPPAAAAPTAADAGPTVPAGLSLLLTRIDDGVDCALLRHLQAQRAASAVARPGAPSTLPVFRIEAISDANPATSPAISTLP